MKIHQFNPEVYPVRLWVTITYNIRELSENFGLFPEGEIKWGDIWGKKATTAWVYKKDDKKLGVLIVFYKREHCNMENVAHEAAHAASFIWEYLGEVEMLGEEANAYLMGWIAKCCEIVKNYKNGQTNNVIN